MLKASKNKKLAKRKAWDYFSKWVHKRDAGQPCITCGRRSSQMDAGHFISRRFEATLFDERNVNLQCIKCNRFENGNQYEHGLRIDKKYGPGTAEKILIKSKMYCNRVKSDYEYIAQTYYDKLKG